ncbi:MAG TPA: hypothetical protein VNN06_01660, partial [Ramlibacter sp.]|nr:hypothetical protein [Ramlibacter sp.]
APAQPRSRQSQAASERRAEAAVDSLRGQQAQDLAKSAPPQQTAEAAKQAKSTSQPAETAEAPKQADLAATARAPAPAAPAAMARAAPPGLALQREASVGDAWSHLRIAAQGRRVELAREQATPRLVEMIEGMVRTTQGQEPLEAPVALRVELIRDGALVGVIELAGPQVRWTPGRRGPGDSFTARADPAQLEALRAEISRLLPR